jgi:DNA (cytosine-5)-methyltransferase 1
MNGLKVLDLFSGIGGFSVGLERAGMQTVAFCEVDKKAQQVLRKHWPNVPIFDDVTTLKGEQIGTVDVICGGFPCQDISLAGKGAGLEGARSGLWWEFHRLIKEIKPSWVIAENVSALRSRGLDTVLRSLAEIGYDAEWHCIPASAVGAPHQRDRIWIIAYPNNTKNRTPEHGVDQNGQTTQQEWQNKPFGGTSRHGATLANAHSNDGRDGGSTKSYTRESRVELGCGGQRQLERNAGQELGDANKLGTQISIEGGYPSQQMFGGSSEAWRATVGDFWSVEPNVGRVANGVLNRVDRIKQLGNAVVPQIPELIGRAINAIA